MLPYTNRSIALAVVMLAASLVACSDEEKKAPLAPPVSPFGPMYIVTGTTKRLNLVPEDEEKVAFKDPIQGTKDAKGECQFKIDPSTMRQNHPTVVGEWNVDTCAGFVYAFRPVPARRPPKGIKRADTITVAYPPPEPQSAQSSSTWDPCLYISQGLFVGNNSGPDSVLMEQIVVGKDASGSFTDSLYGTRLNAYGGHYAADQYNAGCARINNGGAVVMTWTGVFPGLDNYYYNSGSTHNYAGYYPGVQSWTPPQTSTLVRFRNAAEFRRTNWAPVCDPGQLIGTRWTPSTDSRNFTPNQSTFDVGFYSVHPNNNYADFGTPGANSTYVECDHPPSAESQYTRLYVVVQLIWY
jgi:hypothetical protein